MRPLPRRSSGDTSMQSNLYFTAFQSARGQAQSKTLRTSRDAGGPRGFGLRLSSGALAWAPATRKFAETKGIGILVPFPPQTVRKRVLTACKPHRQTPKASRSRRGKEAEVFPKMLNFNLFGWRKHSERSASLPRR